MRQTHATVFLLLFAPSPGNSSSLFAAIAILMGAQHPIPVAEKWAAMLVGECAFPAGVIELPPISLRRR